MKQKLPRFYGITVWDLRPLLSCCWGYSLGLFFFYDHASHAGALHVRETLWRLAYMNLCLAT